MSPIQAVAARRFHHQWHPNVLFMESGIRRIVHESLRHKGHRLELISAAGINQSVSARDGELRGASDLRKHGRAAGF
ncbi:MAG: gamma-glutamyltransferase family protein [Fuerstiella sp.]|nr:gamma-glutamyltransferase family protein [Fuerstiella sp.]